MPEPAPEAQHDRQVLLQHIVSEVHAEHAGGDVDVVREALTRLIAERGFPEQPQKWVDDTAAELSQGRHVVVDRELGIDSPLEETSNTAENQSRQESR
ncbi:hypothetical protein SAMN06264364_11874 [Quadrisphaera granulorum]|uniref:Uncharacterized protein n=1 Tax=Quadrisphaera granulorum TaxID=317664 RepID=A0A316A567_9ACTN|nr:hypothetical protein [Quadrisphaera granulorum]PWJ52703.1 hypothetical protein BXY45_11874 [Quadrisphaera granulorum]SZE97525.1 hypothetical protein SAMN06264364_11874 [Quadrisphaera granulorum]